MSGALRVAGNLFVGALLLGGAALIWVGLRELVFGGAGRGQSAVALTLGFTVWLAVAGLTRTRSVPWSLGDRT